MWNYNIMKMSKTCNLILSTVYSYDFSACVYNILKSIGWDLSDINFEDKKTRNIQIGLLQKDNPQLSKYLINSIDSLVDSYFSLNSIGALNIIVRARDGFLITKKLENTNHTMPIDFRGTISKLIITPERDKYIAIYPNGKVEVKGISKKVVDCSFYELFRNLNFGTKKGLLLGLENMRKSVLNSDNIMWFSGQGSDEMYHVPIINEGLLRLSRSALSMIDPSEVDKQFLWEEYIWPFARAILIHCHA